MEKTAMKTAKTASFDTDRLNIRLMTLDEWKLFVDHAIEADEVYETFAHEKDEEFCECLFKPDFGRAINYTLHLKDTDEMIGYVGFNTAEDDPNFNNLAYYIFKDHRRKGYAREAVSALIEKILNREIYDTVINTIHAYVVWNNAASARLIEQLGFEGQGYIILDSGIAEHHYRYEAEKMEETA